MIRPRQPTALRQIKSIAFTGDRRLIEVKSAMLALWNDVAICAEDFRMPSLWPALRLRPAAVAACVICALVGGAEADTRRAPAIVAVCAPCHGVEGTGGDVEKPNLAGQKSIYLRQQLLAFRTGKRKHPDMRTISRELTDREIDQLVVYYSTLVPR
jgi:cytochrome c553